MRQDFEWSLLDIWPVVRASTVDDPFEETLVVQPAALDQTGTSD